MWLAAPRAALADVRALMARAERVVVLTGAGIGAGSGLPTFTGPDGSYSDSVERSHDSGRLPFSLPGLWGFWGPMRELVSRAQPNAAHLALASWGKRLRAEGLEFTLVTQNVDDLQERAGSTDVSHLHGDLFGTRCADPGCGYLMRGDRTVYRKVPACPNCGGPLRPSLVLFGEPVALLAMIAATRAVRRCDVFIAIGTSGEVAPANELVLIARAAGALTVRVNPTTDPASLFDVDVPMTAETAMRDLVG